MNAHNESRLEEIRRRAQGALAGELNYEPPVGDVLELIQMIDELRAQITKSLALSKDEIEGAAV